jgi:hypothetical protein
MIVVPGALAAAVRCALLPWLPIPYPATHDEFSYLLGADTFAHGRLTNPTHPLWRFFETIHELSIPTYASKYPPGQAFFLAIGERFLAHPFFGVLLTFVLFVTAVTWMLRGWVPPAVALLGGAFTAIAFGAGQNWLESYMGGFVGATGAALIVGALGRLRGRDRLTLAWPIAIGAVLLWFTRPYEGGVFVFVVLAILLARPKPGLVRFAAVLAACCLATLAFQARYDERVTGKPWLLPYMLHSREYDYAPALWIEAPRTPALAADPVVQHFHHDFELGQYNNERHRVFGHFSAVVPLDRDVPPSPVWKDVLKALEWLIGIPVLALFAVRYRRDAAVRLLSGIALVSMIPIVFETFIFFHYMVAVVVTLIALTFRLVHLDWPRSRRFVVVLFLAAAGNNAYRIVHAIKDPVPFRRERLHVERDLAARPGRQVVFVRYAPTHGFLEWVFNSADIDGQHVVWARDLGPHEDRQLIDYYHGSQFWLLDADASSPEPTPYQ